MHIFCVRPYPDLLLEVEQSEFEPMSSVRSVSLKKRAQRAKEQGLLAGGKSGESRAIQGTLGSQPKEVKTISVDLRAGFSSAKTCESLIGWS